MAVLVVQFGCWPLLRGKLLLVCVFPFFPSLSYSKFYFGNFEFLESFVCLVMGMLTFSGRVCYSELRSAVPAVLSVWFSDVVAGFALCISSHLPDMQILLYSSCTALLQLSGCF